MLYTGEGIAISVGERKISYKELFQKVNLFSSTFINKTGHAVIYSDNRAGWAYAFYSVWNNGMVPVPVDYLLKKDDLVYIFKDCSPSVVFTTNEKKGLVLDSLIEAAVEAQVIVVDEMENVLSGSLPDKVILKYQPDDVAVIIYTSGTTGKPKGVMLTYENIKVNIEAVSHQIPIYTADDTTLMLLPLHHILPLLGTLVIPLYTGGSVAICPSMASEDILRVLNENKVSLVIGVPRLYTAIRGGLVDKINKKAAAKMLFKLAKKINSLRFSRFIFASVQKKFGGNIRYLVSGGAALDVDVHRDMRAVGFEILEGYGMTEAAPMITFARPGKVKVGSPVKPCSALKLTFAKAR